MRFSTPNKQTKNPNASPMNTILGWEFGFLRSGRSSDTELFIKRSNRNGYSVADKLKLNQISFASRSALHLWRILNKQYKSYIK